jgi:hypothetical protein
MKIQSLCCAVLGLALHAAVHAQPYKCKEQNGGTSFQDTPCASSASAPARKLPAPGEKNESFSTHKKDDGPGGNWSTTPRSAQDARVSPGPSPVRTGSYVGNATPAAAATQSWQDKERDFQKRKAQAQVQQAQADADRDKAFNRSQRCNYERQQLGVLKEARPVYSRDNKGERQYMADENRPAAVDAAQRKVDAACN